MKVLDVLDKESGARVRALLASALAVATFIVAIAQAALDSLDVLPQWDRIGAVAMILQGTISYVGRFTAFADKVAD